MLKLPSKATMYIIIAIVIIGLFVFIYFIGRRSAKTKIEQVTLPTDQPGGDKISVADAATVRQIATKLHDDMSGFSWGFHSATPYNDMMKLSDTLFVAVYNDFNNLYGSENEGTLREWIASERALYAGVWTNVAGTVIERMDKLGLR